MKTRYHIQTSDEGEEWLILDNSHRLYLGDLEDTDGCCYVHFRRLAAAPTALEVCQAIADFSFNSLPRERDAITAIQAAAAQALKIADDNAESDRPTPSTLLLAAAQDALDNWFDKLYPPTVFIGGPDSDEGTNTVVRIREALRAALAAYTSHKKGPS